MTETAFSVTKDYERLSTNINPGGWLVDTDRPISTLLGSCVAVCLHDPGLGIGGMNHFLLPTKHLNAADTDDTVLSGDRAMNVLLDALLSKGASRDRMVAKAFGGGTIVSSIQMDIGERNARFASDWLGQKSIPLIASDFGGPWSRKVIYVPRTGQAFCRRSSVSPLSPDIALFDTTDTHGRVPAKAGHRRAS